MKYLLVLLLITSFFCNTNCRAVSTKTEADNYGQFSHRSPEVEIKNDTFPPKKIYARYGDIILDRNVGNGALMYISDDERFIISQPWDGLLIYREKNKGDFKIEYYDKNHILLKQIDLKKVNPYKKEKYNLLSDEFESAPTGVTIEKYIMDDTLYVYKKHITEYGTQIRAYDQSSNLVNIMVNKNKRVAVCFDLIPMNQGSVIGWESTIFAYDSLGNLTDKIENLRYDIEHPQITRNGKYLTFTYGNTMDDDFNFLRKYEGAVIFDIKDKRIIYHEQSKIRGDNTIYGFSEPQEDLIFFSKSLQPFSRSRINENRPYRSMIFFDMKKRVKYFKDIKLNEISPRNLTFDKTKEYNQYLDMYDFETSKF